MEAKATGYAVPAPNPSTITGASAPHSMPSIVPNTPWKQQVWAWLKEIVPYSQMERYVQITQNTEASFDVVVCTQEETYRIGATPRYLGCIAWSRRYRAGENWTRGTDLPDGPLDEHTWRAIKDAIVRYELVKMEGIMSENYKEVAPADTPRSPRKTCSCGPGESCTDCPPTDPRPEAVFYGPHPCSACGKTIAKQSIAQGGIAFDYPEGPIYPTTPWVLHQCPGFKMTEDEPKNVYKGG